MYPGRDQEDIIEGPFDPMVDADYKANRLGAEAGIALFKAGMTDVRKVISIFRELDEEKYHNFDTEPMLLCAA